MYNQSFSASFLLKCLRKTDFYDDNRLYDKEFRSSIGILAENSAHSEFQGGNPFATFHLNGKRLYKINDLHNNLVVRKIDRNLKKALGKRIFSRDFIISTAKKMLSESTPYRVYRLDIKAFFESINQKFLREEIDSLAVSPLTKKNVFCLLDYYNKINGVGIPRGVGISSTLAEITLSNFDASMSEHDNVYYYIRYVDDILIITNGNENSVSFLQLIENKLPLGLGLNRKKHKLAIHELKSPTWGNTQDELLCSITYLGYVIKIYNPQKTSGAKFPFRKVILDIAESKVKKIKTRIVRSFITYSRDKNYQNLKDRLRLLTSNYSMYDINSGRKKFAGIFYNYPLISQNSKSISELDNFRKNAILSKKGRVFCTTYSLIKPKNKSDLLQFDFKTGFNQRKFVHFNRDKVQELQSCWSTQ